MPLRRQCGRALARLALEPGEVEVLVEVALLLDELCPLDDEAVRLEQRADVDVGEEPRVRGVARPLEAVELDGDERVARRDLVDHQHASARARHPGELGDEELRAAHVVEGARAPRDVERPGENVEPRAVALDERDVREVRGAQARLLEQLGRAVDRDHLGDPWGERERERARSGADVDRALGPRRAAGTHAPPP